MLFNKKYLSFIALGITFSMHAGILTINNQSGEDLNISSVYQGKATAKNTWRFNIFLSTSGTSSDIDYGTLPPQKISIAHPNYFIGEITDPLVFSKNANLIIRKISANEYTAEWKQK